MQPMRTTWWAGASVVAAIALGFAAGGRAEGEQAARIAWEHRVERVSFDQYEDSPVYRRLAERASDTLTAVYAYQQFVLERLGREGWQLVTVQAKTPAETVFYLRRPVTR